MNEKKQVCSGLELRQSQDGHWLSFSSKEGKHASICLENQKGIAGKAMLAWAKDFWAESSEDPEMPRYKCHKEVHALKIDQVLQRTSDAFEIYVEKPFAPVVVEKAFVEQHKPKAGGYLVYYKDGYRSYSPAEAFKDGYTRIN